MKNGICLLMNNNDLKACLFWWRPRTFSGHWEGRDVFGNSQSYRALRPNREGKGSRWWMSIISIMIDIFSFFLMIFQKKQKDFDVISSSHPALIVITHILRWRMLLRSFLISAASSSGEGNPAEGDGNVLGSTMGMLSSSSMGMLSSLSSVVQSTVRVYSFLSIHTKIFNVFADLFYIVSFLI